MNCFEMGTLARELGRASLMDAAVRRAALAHCETCAACAARLRDERTLSAGLRALAARDEMATSSESVEAELLAAFRQQKLAAIPAITFRGPAATQAARILHWRRWAVAAAVLLALGLLTFSARRTPPEESLVIEPSPVPTTATAPPSVVAKQAAAPLAEDDGQTRRPLVTRRRALANHSNQIAVQAQDPDVTPLLIRDGMTIYDEEAEVMTDFVSLEAGDADAPLESGQLLRVEVPRQTLARYGLPINAALTDATVKADLLVGEDGRAHAIRFVR